MKRDRKLLSEITHLIYNAGLYPEQWVDVVSRLHFSLGANKSILFTPFIGPQHGGMAFPVGFSQESLELWESKFINKDEIGKRMMQMKLFFSGNICTERDLFPTKKEYQAYLDSPIYRGYAGPNDLHHNCVGVVFEGSPDLPATVYSAWRGVNDAGFNQDDREWLGILISHISRAMGIMIRFDTARLQTATLQATLDRMKFGVVMLNDEFQVIHLNRAAQTVLKRNDGIRLNDCNVLDSRPEDTHIQVPQQRVTKIKGNVKKHIYTLASWLNSYKYLPEDAQQHFLHCITISRKSKLMDGCFGSQKRNQYVVQCAPLPESEILNSYNASARYAVFITDPQAVKLPSIEKLAAIYGLSDKEANISLAFVEQGSYRGVAHELGISENTVRWHIKNIYPKLGIYKLADLVRLVTDLGESGV